MRILTRVGPCRYAALTTSGSDRGRALADAGASGPAPAQRLGERPVVPGQVRHLPVELRDLLPQGFDLPPQGHDLLGVLPLRLLVLRGPRQINYKMLIYNNLLLIDSL